MRQNCMMGSLPDLLCAANRCAGSVGWSGIDGIPHVSEAGNFVNSHPVGDAIAQSTNSGRNIIGVVLRHLSAAPGTILVLQRLRAIPVE